MYLQSKSINTTKLSIRPHMDIPLQAPM